VETAKPKRRIVTIKVSLDNTMREVKKKVFEGIGWKVGFAADLVLYTPLSAKAEFDAFAPLQIVQLNELSPTYLFCTDEWIIVIQGGAA
jgi:hypothetical protein